MSALPRRYFTQEEYLALEEKAEYKSQYVAGEVFAMAGAQPWHIEIVDNLTMALRGQFRGCPCKSYSSEMRVRAKAGDIWTYPDVAALCGQPRFDTTADPNSLLNPQAIFEVLSPSTELFDRGDKFARYRRMESLTDYILVDSQLMRVEHFVRQENNSWTMTEYIQPADRIPLRSLNCELSLEEIYYQVIFPGEPHEI